MTGNAIGAIVIATAITVHRDSLERVMAAHKKQVQTYLKLTGGKLGYLLDFGEAVIKTGITRYINGLEE